MKYLLFCLACLSLTAGNGANLKTAKSIDLKPQAAGAEVATTLHLANDGDAPLTVSKIDTPCGCTTTDFAATVLQPGESTDVQVTVRTARLNGDYDKTLHVVSDDADSPKTPVRIRFAIQGEAVAAN